MFCTNCGTQFEGNFCPKCGTPSFSADAREPFGREVAYPEPPIGEYKATPGTLIIRQDHIVIVGKKINLRSYDLEIPYVAIQNAHFNKAPLGGSLRIEWDIGKAALKDIPITKNYHIFEFSPARFKDFSVAYEFLNSVAYINSPSKASVDPVKAALESLRSTSAQIVERPLSKRERIKENKKNGVACCPKCGSTSISANRKGFGVGKAAAGAFLAGPYGLVAGGIGSKKVVITCLNCGYQWKP